MVIDLSHECNNGHKTVSRIVTDSERVLTLVAPGNHEYHRIRYCPICGADVGLEIASVMVLTACKFAAQYIGTGQGDKEQVLSVLNHAIALAEDFGLTVSGV